MKEGGKFDFDYYFAFLTNFLKRWNFCLVASDSARQKDHFQKKMCPKRTFSSNFVKLISKILFFLAEKIVVFCFVCFVSFVCFVCLFCLFGLFCLFVCFVCLFCLLQLCPILADFFLIKALIELRNILLRKNYSMYGLGIAQPLR